MYYFRKAGDTYSPNRYTFDSILFFYVVNMLLCFFVSLGFTRLVSLAVRVRWLYLFCMIVSLFFSILWYLPIRGFFSVIIFVLVFLTFILLTDGRISDSLSSLVGGQISFIVSIKTISRIISSRTDITAFIYTAFLSFIGSGVLIRKKSAVIYHVSALITALLSLLFGVNKVMLWEVLYICAALIYRTGYAMDNGREMRFISSYVKPLGISFVLCILFYTELPYAAEIIRNSKLSIMINGLLSPFFYNIALLGKTLLVSKAPPMPDLCFEYGVVSFAEVFNDYSLQKISMFIKTNLLRLIILLTILLAYLLFSIFMVRRQNAQLKAGSRRIRQTNRRRALQEIGEAAGRLATWYTGIKITPWDDDFVVKTASVLPHISGVDLERMTSTMNHMRYGKDEIIEEDYRKSLEIYLQMFRAGRNAPSEAVRRKLKLPI